MATGLVTLGIVFVPFLYDDIPMERPLATDSQTAVVQPKAPAKGNAPHIVEAQDQRADSMETYHTVFSTGCSTFQDWQSYVFFYHLLRSGQEGPVTRIASGCTEKDATVLQEIFEQEIAVMSPKRFRLHLTPEFSHLKPDVEFKYVSRSIHAKDSSRGNASQSYQKLILYWTPSTVVQ